MKLNFKIVKSQLEREKRERHRRRALILESRDVPRQQPLV